MERASRAIMKHPARRETEAEGLRRFRKSDRPYRLIFHSASLRGPLLLPMGKV